MRKQKNNNLILSSKGYSNLNAKKSLVPSKVIGTQKRGKTRSRLKLKCIFQRYF